MRSYELNNDNNGKQFIRAWAVIGTAILYVLTYRNENTKPIDM